MRESRHIKSAIWTLAALFAVLISVPFLVPGLGFLALTAFAPLFLMEELITRNGIRRAWWYYFCAFLAFNVLSTWWIWNVSPAGSVAAILINTLEMSLVFAAFRIFKRRCRRGGKVLPYVFFIALWLAWEHVYFNIELSWPWLVLGNAFATSVNLVQWYELTGALGGSLWILVSGFLTFRLICAINDRERAKARRRAVALACTVLIPAMASMIRYNSYTEKGSVSEAVLAQPNIDPFEKFGVLSQEIIDSKLLNLFESQITPQTKYLITPETFTYDIDIDNPESNPSFNRYLEYLGQHPQAEMLLGALTRQVYMTGTKPTSTARDGGVCWYDIYNTAMTITPAGKIDYYHKSKLVPGVEIIPYQNSVPWLGKLVAKFGGSSNSYGIMQRMKALNTVDGSKVAPMICYESLYGDYSRNAVLEGAGFIAVITNDGWWGDTPGYHQHFRFARLRAIETRRDVAHAANTGTSGFINQRGDILQKTDWWVETAIRGEVHVNHHLSFFTKHGDLIGRLAGWTAPALILLLIGLCVSDKISSRGKSA